MGKKPIVKLRVYRGTELNYDANGVIKNENQIVALEHNSKSWVLFMKNLHLNGYCKVNVESAFKEYEKGGYDEIKDVSELEKEVQLSFNQLKEKVLTADQKRIAELEEKINTLISTKKESKKEPKKEELEEDKDSVIAEYTEVVGKKPFGGWDIKKIKEKQAEFLAKEE